MGGCGTPTAFPEFAWSESRDRRLRQCRRLYYLSVYAAHGGWARAAPAERRTAWTLGRLIPSWRVALGSAVHEAAERCVRASATGKRLPSFSQLRRAAGETLNHIFVSSERIADFLREPNAHPMLASRFYGEPWNRDEIAKVREDLDRLLRSLLARNDLWARVATAGLAGVWMPDRWLAFTLDLRVPEDRVRVFGAPDLVLRVGPDEPVEVWDWKTGMDDGAIDAILTYGLAVRHASTAPPFVHGTNRWMQGRVIRLGLDDPMTDTATFRIDEQDLAAARERIAGSVDRMRTGLRNVVQNEPAADAYPPTSNSGRCQHCSYRGMCHPGRYVIASVNGRRENQP